VSRLHAIVDVDAAQRAASSPIDIARAFLEGGARFLQLRAKSLSSSALLELADLVVREGAAAGASVVINDRVDVALLSGAAGVHLGQDDLSPSAARIILGPAAIVGYSTHDVAQIENALRQPSSYIAVGPVFGTTTKATGYEAVGLDLVRKAVSLAQGRPVVAIGGITLERAPGVIAAGASAVAVIGDLLATGDPRERVRSYLQALA
jgi:thiamine-phosphate pyrophosphorylase